MVAQYIGYFMVEAKIRLFRIVNTMPGSYLSQGISNYGIEKFVWKMAVSAPKVLQIVDSSIVYGKRVLKSAFANLRVAEN